MDHRHAGRLGFVLFAFFAVGAVSIVPGAASAQHCADPSAGWRGCDGYDTACPGDSRANFYSQEEVEDYLVELDTNHDPGDHLALIPIGESVVQGVFGLGPAIPSETFPLVVARVAEDATDPEIDKPAILLVADVHPQEWIGSEVALGYIDYLVQGINSGDTDVTSLLEDVEIWVVVVANAAGRWWDDLSSYGDPGDAVYDQRKNAQWRIGLNCPAESLTARHSGICDYGSGDWWYKEGVNVARNFSTEWPIEDNRPYTRREMGRHLSGSSSYPRWPDGDSVLAPEEFVCDPNNNECPANYPDHPHCVQRGGTAVVPINGCFMADPDSDYDGDSMAACENYVATHAVADELGTEHICVWTEVVPGDFRALLWECGAGLTIDQDPATPPFSYTVSHAQAPNNLDVLRRCENGILMTCRSDAECDDGTVDDGDFDPNSPHSGGDRYCTDDGYCAVSETHTCCGPDYRGERPFDTLETRALRTLMDNVPFAFVVDMHSTRMDFTVACKNMNEGCCSAFDAVDCPGGRNEEWDNNNNLRMEAVTVYNAQAQMDWPSATYGSALPTLLQLEDHGTYGLNRGAGQLPAWASSVPAATTDDPVVTGANFDNGTYRGITAFTWELGAREWRDIESANEELDFNGLILCESSITGETRGGSRPRSTMAVESQLEGGRAMIGYLAGQAAVPNTARTEVGAPFGAAVRRDLALGGLRISDGRGRGIQQLEVLPTGVDGDPNAVTVVPAGRWEVSFDVIAGSTTDPGSVFVPFNANVVIGQYRDVSTPMMQLYSLDSNHIEVLSMTPRTRERVSTRFEFVAGETYLVKAEVTGSGADDDTQANNVLVAKFIAVDCTDSFEIPNGLDGDEFCAEGLPFDDDRFECNYSTGKCRECWDGQSCPSGGFCVDGMCDDNATCWSGEVLDEYEGASGSEASPTLLLSGPSTITRTLYNEADQDVDTARFLIPSYVDAISYVLGIKVYDHCLGKIVDPDPWWMNEVSVRAWYWKNTLTKTKKYVVGGESEWVTPHRFFGIIQPMDAETMAAVSGMQRELQVEIKNSDSDIDRANISYTLEVKMKSNPYPDFSGGYIPEPGTVGLAVTDSAELAAEPGTTRRFMLTQEVVERGGLVVLEPTSLQEPITSTTTVVLRDKFGQVPRGGYGVEYGEGVAVSLSEAIPDSTPYTLSVTNDYEAVSGRVFACPPDVEECIGYEPLLGTCGPNCQGDDVSCCVDENGVYECRNVRGSDEENCGGCDKACEWDEICLNGVCATGEGTSCWNTQCSEGTTCVSDSWFWQTDPSCKAILVDAEYCGYWGDTCDDNEVCRAGLCLPKILLPCDMACGAGESCCWSLGTEECRATEEDTLNCGGCGNVCPVGTVCQEGLCIEWYHAFDVCLGSSVNCGTDGLDCVDVAGDEGNCGGCGLVCPDKATCVDGACVVATERVNLDE